MEIHAEVKVFIMSEVKDGGLISMTHVLQWRQIIYGYFTVNSAWYVFAAVSTLIINCISLQY